MKLSVDIFGNEFSTEAPLEDGDIEDWENLDLDSCRSQSEVARRLAFFLSLARPGPSEIWLEEVGSLGRVMVPGPRSCGRTLLTLRCGAELFSRYSHRMGQ